MAYWASRDTAATGTTTMVGLTDVRASRDGADSPSTGVIRSLDTSRARSGGPIRQRHTATATLCSAGCPSDTPVL